MVGVLPKTEDTVNFFTMEACFSKMKKSAVFMNIGRGQTVKEDELIVALQQGVIAGAALDVFAVEPLSHESPLWSMPNVLIYPHCANNEIEYIDRVFEQIVKNFKHFVHGEALNNVCNKKLGY